MSSGKKEFVKVSKDYIIATEETLDDYDLERGNRYAQWAMAGNGIITPTFKTKKIIPPGVYKVSYSDQLGYFLKNQNLIIGDTVLKLPIKETVEILKDISTFWTLKDSFKKYNSVFKRGILLYGDPGCGKSYLIQNLINEIISENKGIVILANDNDSLSYFLDFIPTIREIEPTRPVLTVLEDIDNLQDANTGLMSKFLNTLDGVNQIDNIVYLATTNYPERLEERIANRPSRFDRVYNIAVPNAEVREFFIKAKLHEDDLKKISLKDWVKKTDGLSLAHIKEIIISTMIFNKDIEEVLVHFEDMRKTKRRSSITKGKTPGFAID